MAQKVSFDDPEANGWRARDPHGRRALAGGGDFCADGGSPGASAEGGPGRGAGARGGGYAVTGPGSG